MNWIIVLILLIAVIILWIFIILKKKKQEKNIPEKRTINISKTIKNPRESLLTLNKIAKNFFREYLHQENSETYVEIEDLLKKKKQEDMIQFCEKMDVLLYSGKEIEKSQALEMIEDFNKIVKHRKNFQKEITKNKKV